MIPPLQMWLILNVLGALQVALLTGAALAILDVRGR